MTPTCHARSASVVIVHGLPSRRTRQPRPPPRSAPRSRGEQAQGLSIRTAERAQRLPAQPDEDPRVALGRLGEDIAADHLRKRGFEVLDRNVRTRAGEIDLIVTDGARLVFVEVKCRRPGWPRDHETTETARALEAIGPAKQARLRRVAGEWLRQRVTGRPFVDELRFDAIAVSVDRDGRLLRLDHLEGAW
jgi:putative endonuclease